MTTIMDVVFPEGTLAVTVKIDLSSVREEAWRDVIVDRHFFIRCYLEDNSYGLLYSSSGIHKQGANEKPHAHIHYVCSFEGKGSPIHSNDSQRRARYIKAALSDVTHSARVVVGVNNCSFEYCSFQYKMMDLSGNHYDTLAYPLKEGIRCDGLTYDGLEPDDIDALEKYAVAIFENQRAIEARRQKHDKKLMDRKSEMLRVAKEYRHLITDLATLMMCMSKYYCGPLPFLEKPRPVEFRNNCQIIAVELGVADYMDFNF